MFRKGFRRGVTYFLMRSSLPLIRWGKRLSAVPVLKWIIAPFFRYPQNEVTAVPINVDLSSPGSVALPRQVLTRVLEGIDDIFLLNGCICRTLHPVQGLPSDLGCLALGPASRMVHPTHGRRITSAEARAHVERAARAGLVASVAHTWIDAVGFGIRPLSRLMFVCFCDDVSCIYRADMRRRGPTLNRAYKKLPGVSVTVDPARCNGCGICVRRCFAGEMRLEDGKAVVGADCKGCGRCAELCPEGAVTVSFGNGEETYRALTERIKAVADVGL